MADIDTVGGSFFTSDDGVEVYYKVWKPAATPVACVLAFHGLGDHINRFDHVFTAFAAAGIVVKGMDYRGHGRTHAKNAEKGSIQGYMGPSIARVWDDMVLLSKMEVDGVPKDLPTFVFGHSLGGLLALSFSFHRSNNVNIRGVIAQAPCLKSSKWNPVPGWASMVTATLGQIDMIAKHAQNNRLDLPYLCRSEKVIQGYKDDKYVHDMISLQVLRDILEQGALLVTKASEFTLPVVTYHSPDDHFTCFDTSEEFIKKCGSTDKLHRSFPGAYHELHNEEDLKDGIIADYIQWITKRL